jgi:hypothetical protein
MAESDLPARGNLDAEPPDPVATRPLEDDAVGTSAGTGTWTEGFGATAETGEEGHGTGAGQGTGASGPGTTAGSGPAGIRAGSEVGAIGSGYGGQVTPGGPTGEPTAEQQARATTLDGTTGLDVTGMTHEADERQRTDEHSERAARQAVPHVPHADDDTGSVRTPNGWQSDAADDEVTVDSMDSFPASDPPAY